MSREFDKPLMEPAQKTTAVLSQQESELLQIGAQVCVVRDGVTVMDFALGRAGTDLPMTTETLMLWLSSSKPVAAIAALQLVEQGRLSLDDFVSHHIPEFAAAGKQDVTIRHLLTHTGGFRFVDIGEATTLWNDILRRLCAAPLERNWVPGQRAGYHPYTSWYVLGEVVQRISSTSFSDYVRREIFLPLGMDDCWIGMPADVRDRYGSQLATLVNTEKPGAGPHPLSLPEGVVRCVPGAGGIGPMRQLVRLYWTLAADGELDGRRILSAESVAQMSARSRVGMFDETFKHTLDWGLGVIPNNRRYGIETAPYGYGRHAGDGAFGHSGSQSSAAFADPENGLAVAVVLNGTCGERRHQPRIRAVLEAIYEDLGVTRAD